MRGLSGGAQRREFERFVRDRTDPLLRTAYLLAGDLAEAEDLVQETLLRVARRWYKVAAMEQPAAYARQILVNLVIDHAGQRARRNSELTAPADGLTERADGAAERALQAVNTQALLLSALAGLPPRQRAVIVLRYWDDLPEAEVATILGCSAGTVKSTASRGLARLREAIAAEPSAVSPQAP